MSMLDGHSLNSGDDVAVRASVTAYAPPVTAGIQIPAVPVRLPTPPWSVEEERIRGAYAKRTTDSSRYSWGNMGHVFQAQERERVMLLMLKAHGMMPLTDKKILEVGSGTGGRLRDFVKWGATPVNLTGVELLAGEVAKARHLLPSDVALECRNAADLPFPDATFDIVLQSTMFTSILDPALKRKIAGEMVRVLKPSGVILWADFFLNNPRNHDVRGVTKPEIIALFPNCWIDLQRTGLLPPVVRRLAQYSWLAAYLLAQIPWLCTHYTGVILPRPQGARRPATVNAERAISAEFPH